jgi:Domain of unknown function (DUF4384)
LKTDESLTIPTLDSHPNHEVQVISNLSTINLNRPLLIPCMLKWSDFLCDLGIEKELTELEPAILLAKFPKPGITASDDDVINKTKNPNIYEHITSLTSLSNCKKSIYSKFGISEYSRKGRGQQEELRDLLLKAFNERNSRSSNINNVDLDYLWRKLLNMAEYTEQKMGLIPYSQNQSQGFRKLRIKNNDGNKYLRQVKIDEDVLVGVCPESKGYLILFQRDVLGTIFCLAPSEYMPNNQIISNDEYIIPQNGSPISSDPSGKTELCAVVISDITKFNWLKEAKTHEVIISSEYLEQLFEYIELNKGNSEIFYTNFLVIE